MKKQIISLGALAVASSLFTWDNKADAIVTKDYSGEIPISNGFWGKSIEKEYINMDILSEDQYLLEKKKALYEKYKEWYKSTKR